MAITMETLRNLASGAHPTATFPCNHLTKSVGSCKKDGGYLGTGWSAPQNRTVLEQLRAAVNEEDWASNYAERRTLIQMQPEWSASPDRCEALRCCVSMCRAKRVLEVGSFCGGGSLALAERLPADGEIVSLEVDPFVVEFWQRFQMKSEHGRKVTNIIGEALPTLEGIAAQANTKDFASFDLIVIDANKSDMKRYFDLIWNTPGFLAPNGVVCVDMTPFKGQPPTRYARFGQAHRWEFNSGIDEINAVRKAVDEAPDCVGHEFGGLLVVRRVVVKPAPSDAPRAKAYTI